MTNAESVLRHRLAPSGSRPLSHDSEHDTPEDGDPRPGMAGNVPVDPLKRSATSPAVLSRPHPYSMGPEDYLNDSFLWRLDASASKSSPTHILRRRIFFILGVALGILLATVTLVPPPLPTEQTIASLSRMITTSVGDLDLGAMMPQGMGLEEWVGNITMVMQQAAIGMGMQVDEEMRQVEAQFGVGEKLRSQEGLTAKHPVILIPGIISTGLENWGVDSCSRNYFRSRIWGTLTMFRAILLDKNCWSRHMKLDPITGRDPEGIRLRAALGLDAADYFIQGYWIWGKIIENLAVLGYDSNSMHLASYDWRLSLENLEIRDGYFTRLKASIELARKLNGEKAVIVAHSMGALIFHYFLQWVQSPLGAAAGPEWLRENIHAVTNVAAPFLGVPKSVAAILSGEMRDTVLQQPVAEYVLEQFYSRAERAELFRSWSGLISLLPRGGDAVWGGADSGAVDVEDVPSDMSGYMIEFRSSESGFKQRANLTATGALNLIANLTSTAYNRHLSRHSFGSSAKSGVLNAMTADSKHWANPLEMSLPDAPGLNVFCLYGVGKTTERAYTYTDALTPVSTDGSENTAIVTDGVLSNMPIDDAMPSDDETADQGIPVWIDPTVTDPERGFTSGMRMSDGDGTVNLVSAAYMCLEGWKEGGLRNPAGVRVVTREYEHLPVSVMRDPRGGVTSGDHVDILGNALLIEDILRIAAGQSKDLEERVIGNAKAWLPEITRRIERERMG